MDTNSGRDRRHSWRNRTTVGCESTTDTCHTRSSKEGKTNASNRENEIHANKMSAKVDTTTHY